MTFDRLRDLSADVRGRVYATLAPLQLALVAFGLLNDSAAAVWVAAVSAALGFTVAGANSTATWRTWLYGLLVPAQALVVYYGVFAENQAATLTAVVASLFGLGVAAAKTPTV
ncbi:phage holin [Nocardia brasiliensis]|uniref:phage holin n=1 Tax=Nocardia brasiliensis TaxID=37326 RepID=UPI002458B2B7|nr:hypothetical protein [Nocardia brasiliensis]